MPHPIPTIEYIQQDGAILGIVIPMGVGIEDPVFFATPPSESMQAGILRWTAGRVVEPHWHPSRTRIVYETQEALFIRKGSVRIEFYDESNRYVTSRQLEAGAVAILLSGGHGLKALTDAEVIEVKQGPYDSARDKVRFLPKEQV